MYMFLNLYSVFFFFFCFPKTAGHPWFSHEYWEGATLSRDGVSLCMLCRLPRPPRPGHREFASSSMGMGRGGLEAGPIRQVAGSGILMRGGG